MDPQKDDDALVDLLDVVLRDGAILRADVIVSVADIPLIGIKLSAAIAGMETMTEYGLFEQWDVDRRARAVERRQYGRQRSMEGRDEEIESIAAPGRNDADADRFEADASDPSGDDGS